MSRFRFDLLALVALVLASVVQVSTAIDTIPTETVTFLRKHLAFSENNLSALSRGQVVRKTLDTHDPGEVVAVGAVKIAVPRHFFIERVRDIVAFKRSQYVLAIGTFGARPQAGDLAGLSLSDEDVEAIRHCRPGDCDIKLTPEMLARFQAEVDWSKPDARTRAEAVFNRLLAERAAAYLSGGYSTLGTYLDKPGAMPVAKELVSMLNASAYLTELAPELRHYLEGFPNTELRNVESFFYWSKESFGVKPVISVTHVTIFTKSIKDTDMTFVVSQGIYMSHYFEGSLALTIAPEIEENPEPAFYLLYVNRSRVDALKGAFSGLRRWIAVRRVRDGMETTLRGVKKRMEAGYVVSQRTSSPTAISPSSRTSP
ncbi:MAG TPA: hypothetical protein VH702_02340 [Vicinamibacterales bacterium]|jgi:hypothetical protein